MIKPLNAKSLKENPEEYLRSFSRKKDFLVAIDTDGCIVDNMNGKQMVIFHPLFMEFYQLWGIETYFREIGEFYNLFSTTRGFNRFLTLRDTIHTLHERQDVQEAAKLSGTELPDPQPLIDFINYASQAGLGLGNPSLESFLQTRPSSLPLWKLLAWSEAVNKTFPFFTAKIPPFPFVEETLARISAHADIVVVSQTPYDDLLHYWRTHKLLQYIRIICGQEMGSKSHHIAMLIKQGGYYQDQVLMIGDAKGDLEAIKEHQGLFYPILPGKEENSWQECLSSFELFLNNAYKGQEENARIARFSDILQEKAEWNDPDYDHTHIYRKKQNIRQKLYAMLNPEGKLRIL
ncbi:MAG: HAD hydrolase-like protein [Candidatus Ratteibacteria bacterium]